MNNRFLALVTAVVLLCSGCGSSPTVTSAPIAPPASDAVPTSSSSAVTPPAPEVPDGSIAEATTTPDAPEPSPVPLPEEPAPSPVAPQPAPSAPTRAPLPSTEEPSVPTEDPSVPVIHFPIQQSAYDFSAPVAECPAVEIDYFADAAFVGDSRTEGFWLYSGIKQGKLLSAVGLTVFTADEKKATGSDQTVLDALCAGDYGKIYLAFGLNELGYIDTDAFVETYGQIIDTVRARFPQAIIYIQTLIPVNDTLALASGFKEHVNCDRVRLYNELIAQIALDKQIPLLDMYSAFAVEGQLPDEASRDGVHLLPAYCKMQLEYLACHTVTWEQLTAVDTGVEAPADASSPDSSIETEVAEI